MRGCHPADILRFFVTHLERKIGTAALILFGAI